MKPEGQDGGAHSTAAASPLDVGGDDVPSGLRWQLTSRFTVRSRQARFARFISVMQPAPNDRILDVGVTDTAWRASNFLEATYPRPDLITAVGLEDMPTFRRLFPSTTFVVADGRSLPFADNAFEIGFSNAVVEHVGSRRDQRRFVVELLRTCRRVFVATPDARFPIDPHTLLPLVHWLPRSIRHPILRRTGNGRWASEWILNPLTARDFIELFPRSSRPRLYRQRVLGLSTVLIVVAESAPST